MKLVRHVVHFRLSVEASNAETKSNCVPVVARTQLEYVDGSRVATYKPNRWNRNAR